MAAWELLKDQNFRLDGRKPNELRRIETRMGVFPNADGSAYLEQGNTKVLASVYGPHEVKGGRGRANPERAVINCQFSKSAFSSSERKTHMKFGRNSSETNQHLVQALNAAIISNLYPRCQIDVYVEIIQSDGSDFCACLNVATLALIDAATLVDEKTVVDVNYVEESSGSAVLIVGLLPKDEEIAYMQMKGRLHADHLEKLLDCAVEGCRNISSILKERIGEHLKTHSSHFTLT